jgi:hypothetical protein
VHRSERAGADQAAARAFTRHSVRASSGGSIGTVIEFSGFIKYCADAGSQPSDAAQ